MSDVDNKLCDVDGRVLVIGDIVRDLDAPPDDWPRIVVPGRRRKKSAARLRYIGHIAMSDVYRIDDWRYRNADYTGVDGRTERVHVAVFILRSSQLHRKGEGEMSELDALKEGFRCMQARGVFGYPAEMEAA